MIDTDPYIDTRPLTSEQAKYAKLLLKIAKLEYAAYLQSWKDNPDRSGGQFTKQEIREASEWR